MENAIANGETVGESTGARKAPGRDNDLTAGGHELPLGDERRHGGVERQRAEAGLLVGALTISRIVLSVALPALPALSPGFLAVCALAGATDMLDGYVARRTGTESELGARLDSIADFALAVVCLAKILPVIAVPTWLWIWVAAIALVKVANTVSGFVIEKRLVMPHTKANKVAGLAAFLVPFAIPLVGITAPAVIACAIATFASVQEGHLIRTGGAESPT